MNKVAVGAAALVVVAGGGTGFAAWSGGKVAKELQAQTTAVMSPFSGVKVVENSVTTGLFSSTHTVTLDIGCPPVAPEGAQPAADTPAPKPLTITWRDHVKHGPVPGGRSLGLAAIDTELVLPPEAQSQVAKVFGDQAPLKAHTVLGFGGNYVSEITSPPLKYAEAGKGDIDWQGLRIVARGKFSGGTPGAGSYSFEAPGLTANFSAEGQGAGSMKIGRMALEGAVTPQAGGSYLMAPSTGHGTIASLSIATTPQGGKPVDVRFENLVFDSATQVDNGLLSAGSSLSMSGRVDDFPVDKIEMKVALKRLHAATYQQLIGRVMQQTFSCTKPDDEAALKEAVALQENMMKDVGTLLTHNPEYALERLAVVVGGKTAELSYSFGTQGVTESDAQLPLPMLLTSKGYANAAFKVDNAWIEQVVKKAVALQPAEGQSPEETTLMAMTVIQATIDGFVQKGLVAREGEAVVSKAAFEGGMLKVNGQPMPLGAMMGGGGH